MNAWYSFLVVIVTAPFLVLPQFLFGLAGGLWCRHVRGSLLMGLVLGFFAIIMPMMLSARNPMVLWGDVVVRVFLLYVVPAVLGSLAGFGVRSRFVRLRFVGLTVLFCVLGTVGYIPLAFAWYPTRAIARQAMCTNNLKRIGMALTKYADAHQGQLPPEDGAKGLDYLLREGFLGKTNDATVFLCPWDEIRHAARPGAALTEDSVSYVYKGSLWQPGSSANAVPICWDKIVNHHSIGVNVLFKDGHVEWIRLKRWEEIRPDK